MSQADGQGAFVVRSAASWEMAATPDGPLTRASLPDVLAAAAVAVAVTRPARTRLHSVLEGGPLIAEDQVIAPVWAWIGRAGNGHVLTEDGHGGPLRLDPADLQLLDALDGRTDVASLPVPQPVEERAERLARLVRAGRAFVVCGSERSVAPPVARPVEPATESRSGSSVAASGAVDGPDGRIPIYAVWHEDHGPLLALGMLTAVARLHRDGALNDVFEIRRPEEARSFLADLAGRSGPAILLCSDYVWSLAQNLEMAELAVEIEPELIVIHGGPSCPKYEADAERFLRTYGAFAHVLVRGEGEATFCELLDALAAQPLDLAALADVAGLSFCDPTDGTVVRTPDRDRIVDLNQLPSPYLTGEFDHIAPAAWSNNGALETNRGCPYGCTFCDWGAATMSRIRMFDQDRVKAEVEWLAGRQVVDIFVTDANFGITSRDVETATWIASVKHRTGYPEVLSWMPAKNTTKHLTQIYDILIEEKIMSAASLSLQTLDEATLAAIDRSNISTEHFIELATDLRRRGIPLQSDLMLGLPGQTYGSYRADLQVMFDLEILPRTWPVLLLPNSPMNEPAYTAHHQIKTDARNIVISTSSYDEDDRHRMVRIRRLFTTLEVFGVLRHVLRWLQWDHGVAATDVMDALLDVTEADPDRYPLLTWVTEQFDLHPLPPVGWSSFYAEVGEFLCERFALDVGASDLRTMLALQQFLMPDPGREFPAVITLEHDYVAYYLDATDELYTTGEATGAGRPLRERAPAEFTVQGDPLDLCTEGISLNGDSRDELYQGEFYMAVWAYELDSELLRHLPAVLRRFPRPRVEEHRAERWARLSDHDPHVDVPARRRANTTPLVAASPIPVELSGRQAVSK